jgi:hypothetical protein
MLDWKQQLRGALKRLRDRRLKAPSGARVDPGKAPTPNQNHAVVLVPQARLFKNNLSKTLKAQKDIHELRRSLNQYQTLDAQAFEDWKKGLFPKERQTVEALREAARLAFEKMEKLEAAAGFGPVPEEDEEDPFDAHEARDAHEAHENPDDPTDVDEAGPDEAPRMRPSLPEDDFLSREAWICMHTMMDILEDPTMAPELATLEAHEAPALVDEMFFTPPPDFLTKRETTHLRKRIAANLRESLPQATPHSAPDSAQFEIELRTFYRKLATRLHPDRVEQVFEQVTELHRSLWHELQAAYAARSLVRIREVEIQYLFHFERDSGGLSVSEIAQVHEKLKAERTALRSELRLVRKNPDFGFAEAPEAQRRALAREFQVQLVRQAFELRDLLQDLEQRTQFLKKFAADNSRHAKRSRSSRSR